MKKKIKNLGLRAEISLAIKYALLILFFVLWQSDHLSPKTKICLGCLCFISLLCDGIFLIIPYRNKRKTDMEAVTKNNIRAILDNEYVFTSEGKIVCDVLLNAVHGREKQELDMKQSGFLALQNQINPHFLYNTLDAIRSDAMKVSAYQIADLIEALSSFFAYTISNMDHFATIQEELDHVREYYYIQKYRFDDRLNLEIDNSEEVDLKNWYIPRLLLQPLVENAISHGLEVRKKKGTITISFAETEKDILIHVKDNGKGMEAAEIQQLNQKLDKVQEFQDKQKKRGGVALTNVNSRIKMLSGDEYGLHIFSVLNVGTDVLVRVPKVDGEKTDEERISKDSQR